MRWKKAMTAEEQDEILDRDPKFQAMRAEQLKQMAERESLLKKDEAPLIEALNAVGWPENVLQCDESRSVWDLVNTDESYPQLLDTLAEHLIRPYHIRTKQGIARALAVNEARRTHIPRVVMDELKKMADPKDGQERGYREGLINTLVIIGDGSLIDEVRQLLADPRYADVRIDLERLAKKISRPSRAPKKRKPE